MTTKDRDLAERARAWVERACAEQGVPVKLSDPLALAKVAEILGEARDARERRAGGMASGRRDPRLGQCSGMTPDWSRHLYDWRPEE
jgi:hypothetical protein